MSYLPTSMELDKIGIERLEQSQNSKNWLRILLDKLETIYKMIREAIVTADHLEKTEVTGTYTIKQYDQMIICSGTFTLTPPPAALSSGKVYSIKNKGTGTITLDGSGSETIDDETTQSIGPYDCLEIYSDGSEWHVK